MVKGRDQVERSNCVADKLAGTEQCSDQAPNPQPNRQKQLGWIVCFSASQPQKPGGSRRIYRREKNDFWVHVTPFRFEDTGKYAEVSPFFNLTL
jgi:hypothetical protein